MRGHGGYWHRFRTNRSYVVKRVGNFAPRSDAVAIRRSFSAWVTQLNPLRCLVPEGRPRIVVSTPGWSQIDLSSEGTAETRRAPYVLRFTFYVSLMPLPDERL